MAWQPAMSSMSLHRDLGELAIDRVDVAAPKIG